MTVSYDKQHVVNSEPLAAVLVTSEVATYELFVTGEVLAVFSRSWSLTRLRRSVITTDLRFCTSPPDVYPTHS